MANTLIWKAQPTETGTNLQSIIDSTNDEELKEFIEEGALKAIELIDSQITDDSLYLMFEWNTTDYTLHAVLTDATKSKDAENTVTLKFSALADFINNSESNQKTELTLDLVEKIHFWLHDYFTTSTEFFKFSLVAIFHSSSRQETRLL